MRAGEQKFIVRGIGDDKSAELARLQRELNMVWTFLNHISFLLVGLITRVFVFSIELDDSHEWKNKTQITNIERIQRITPSFYLLVPTVTVNITVHMSQIECFGQKTYNKKFQTLFEKTGNNVLWPSKGGKR